MSVGSEFLASQPVETGAKVGASCCGQKNGLSATRKRSRRPWAFTAIAGGLLLVLPIFNVSQAADVAPLLGESSDVNAQSVVSSPDPSAADAAGYLALQTLWRMSGSSLGRLDVMSAGGGGAHLSEAIESLSLADAMRLGRQKSHVLGASQAKTQVSVETARAAYAGVLPSLNLRLARGLETSTPSSRLDIATSEPLPTSTQTRVEAYAVLSQPLLDLAATAEIRRTDAIRQASEADEEGVQGEVNYDLAAAFYGAVEASIILRLTSAQQQRLERLWTWVSARAEVGGTSGAERERIRARVLAAKSAVEDAKAQLNQANISLSRLTRSAATSLQLPTASDVQAIGSLDDALADIKISNPAVLTARANQAAAKEERRGQLAKFAPVVRFELSDNRVKNSGGIEGWKDDRRAMVVMTMPLFSGGADFFRQRAALAKEQQYEHERLEAERSAQQSLQIAFSGLSFARQKLDSLRQQSVAQERVVLAFDAQLSATSRNLLDVFDAYQQYHQSQVDLARTSIQAILLQHQVLRVTGRLSQKMASKVGG